MTGSTSVPSSACSTNNVNRRDGIGLGSGFPESSGLLGRAIFFLANLISQFNSIRFGSGIPMPRKLLGDSGLILDSNSGS